MSVKLSYCGQEVRRLDWERFICAVFAPPGRREALFALLALDLELAKTRRVVSEPLLGEIRLQWWRDAIDKIYDAPGEVPLGNPILEALKNTLTDYHLSRAMVVEIIDGYIADLWIDAPVNSDVIVDFAEATSANLTRLMLHILNAGPMADDHPVVIAGNAVGVAWGISAYLKSGRNPPDLKPPLSEFMNGKLAEARALRRQISKRYLPALLPASMIDAGGQSRLRKQLKLGFNAVAGVF